jgi:putative transposase
MNEPRAHSARCTGEERSTAAPVGALPGRETEPTARGAARAQRPLYRGGKKYSGPCGGAAREGGNKRKMVETLSFTRGNLPHWLVTDHAYFVTLRLAGTIPKTVVAQLQAERSALAKANADEQTLTALSRRQFLRVEQSLHAIDNTRDWLTRPGVPEIVLGNLDWLRQERGWRIYAATALSNHVHLLLRNAESRNGRLLEDIARYKNFVAAQANRILDRKGPFWSRESFDHWCRDEGKVIGVARYICQNPVQAGLVRKWYEWPWTKCEEWLRPENGEM